jgi:hypothetical protein
VEAAGKPEVALEVGPCFFKDFKSRVGHVNVNYDKRVGAGRARGAGKVTYSRVSLVIESGTTLPWILRVS